MKKKQKKAWAIFNSDGKIKLYGITGALYQIFTLRRDAKLNESKYYDERVRPVTVIWTEP